MRFKIKKSDHAEFHFSFLGDHILVPCGIPDELDICFVDFVDGEDLCLGICGDDRAHAAARGGESHFHLHDFLVIDLFDGAVVNEAEVDDVDRDFRIINAFELCPDLLFERGVLEADGIGLLLLFLLCIDSEGIGIL